jgi:hypothetical protein
MNDLFCLTNFTSNLSEEEKQKMYFFFYARGKLFQHNLFLLASTEIYSAQKGNFPKKKQKNKMRQLFFFYPIRAYHIDSIYK